MSTTALILDYIERLPAETLFTTRELLSFGARSAIDNLMSSLVRIGRLTRVVRGVFHRVERKSPVSVDEVARVKAQSFGRAIIEHGENVAIKLGLRHAGGRVNPFRFQISGRSSSFVFHSCAGAVRIFLDGTSPKKISLGDDRVGQAIRALCQIRDSVHTNIEIATGQFTIEQQEKIVKATSSMPHWLSSEFATWFRARLEERLRKNNNKSGGVMEKSVHDLWTNWLQTNPDEKHKSRSQSGDWTNFSKLAEKVWSKSRAAPIYAPTR